MAKYLIVTAFLLLSNGSNCDSISVFFLGDTYFGECYQQDPKFNYGINVIDERSYDSFFENVKDLLLGSDLAIANLETALVNGGETCASTIGNYIHFADTKNTPSYLAKYNIKAVTLANNHTMDLGANGLISTINALDINSIVSFGAGDSEEAASKPFLKEFISGGRVFRLYVIGCYWQRSVFEEKGYYASGNKSGVNMLDTVLLGKQIREIKRNDESAYIVLYPHWGSNYTSANEFQKTSARLLINAGADLIIGHAAHTVQEAEYYEGKWIFYNIGNFIFNAPGRYRSTGAKPYGLMVQLIVDDMKTSFRIYPVFTDNRKSDYTFRLLDINETKDCMRALVNESSAEKLVINQDGIIEVR